VTHAQGTADPVEAAVHVFGVPRRSIPRAMLHVGRDARALRAAPGLVFGRILGTGNGRSFTVRGTDLRHWALVTSWRDAEAARAFERSPVVRGWDAMSEERLLVRLRPLTTRGRWGGQEPFGDPTPYPVTGAVASITRARIAPRSMVRFWRAVPAVARDLAAVDGVRLAIGIGEAPVGFQGTFSIWESSAAVTAFAHHRSPHQVAVRRSGTEHWYAEELFARFEVLGIEGTYAERTP
jgi:heme-degrading monooxygenase HmoA